MLGDRVFYPLAFLAIAAIVALALLPGGGEPLSEEDIAAKGWKAEGVALNALDVSPGSNADYRPDEGGFLRLAQFTPDGEGPASIGIFATLAPAYERAFAGRQLRISFRARSNPNNPLGEFEAAYFTMEGENSGWQEFNLEPEWRDYSFDYVPPETDVTDSSVDLLALFPGREGNRREMDISSVRIEVVDAP